MGQTVTVDTTHTLTISGYREASATQLSQYAKFNTSDSKYDHKLMCFGRVKTAEVDCMEKEVVWTSSEAKYLKDKMRAGDTVAFSISVTDEGANVVHSESFNAKVIGLSISYSDIGVKNIRYFTVSFQESP